MEDELLNIKQAAAFLKVSEVSLRRWTNAGALNCLRVGAKRERRFRRQDLIAFMTQEGGGAVNGQHHANMRTLMVDLEGLQLTPGSHLGSVYRSDFGRLKLSVPFLVGGLAARQHCLLIANEPAQQSILDSCRATRPELETDLADRLLMVESGTDDLDALYEFLERRFHEIFTGGASLLRVLGDMAWAPDLGIAEADLMAFEARYERRLGRRYPVVALCQYDSRRFTGTGVLDAILHHQDTFQHPINRFLG